MEEWKQVKGYESYEVSNLGRVCRNQKILQGTLLKNGYRNYGLWKGNEYHWRTGHSLVAEAFIGERPEGLVIDHIDNNKQNNCLENLRYITYSQNLIRKIYTNPMRCIGKTRNNKFVVRVSNKNCGTYNTLEEAIEIRNKILNEKII